MSDAGAPLLSLTSRWFIRPGREAEVLAAVRDLAARVHAEEPGTLTYLAHTPWADAAGIASLPLPTPQLLLFFEVYRDADAFRTHREGPAFTDFVRDYGDAFVGDEHGRPYSSVEFVRRDAGFVRGGDAAAEPAVLPAAGPSPPANRHPAVMFEIIAREQRSALAFYAGVFGWNYQTDAAGFAYVHFPPQRQPLLGGIGQADSKIPGFEPGHNFYLQVDDLDATIAAAVAAGGTKFVDPTPVDGYRYAMIRDPEGNPIGLIEPFAG